MSFSTLIRGQSPAANATLPPGDAALQAGWGLNVTRASVSRFSGRGIRIALLDSGFHQPHPDFTGRQIIGHSFVPREDPLDRIGHGTHCGAVACGPIVPTQFPRYGAAWDAQMWVLKVLGPGNTAKPEWLEAGLETAIAHRCEIVCMPIAFPVAWGTPHSAFWELLAQRALAAGVLVLAATGNQSKRSVGRRLPVGHPANCPSIVAVGAVDMRMQIADFSNGGSRDEISVVDLVAPGVDIFAAHLAPGHYRVMSGTSQAVAFAAGIAAMHAEKTGLRGAALRSELLRTALALALDRTEMGAGLVQAP
jgi:subtilisin family serine protease